MSEKELVEDDDRDFAYLNSQQYRHSRSDTGIIVLIVLHWGCRHPTGQPGPVARQSVRWRLSCCLMNEQKPGQADCAAVG